MISLRRLCLSALFLFAAGSSVAQPFVHPGGLHRRDDLDRMRTKVAARESPWIEAWDAFVKDHKAQADWTARPSPDMRSRQRAQDDATAMYYNALRWYLSGDEAHARCAVRIANAWADTVNARPTGDDLSGIPIGSFALAAEVLRVYPGWQPGEFEKFKSMLKAHWTPKSLAFLRTHRGDKPDRSWANWDACNMLALLGTGVLCDDRAMFDEAVEYFKTGAGRGSIGNAVPFLHPGGLGQWQEAGRDLAHTMGGQGLLAEFCQVAWNQGVDLFSHDDHRLLKGAEHTAQYTLWQGVPYTFYTNSDQAKQYYISANYRGRLDASHFELLHNHYVVRMGLAAPNVSRLAALRRPEPGEVDVFGHGTLTFTLDAAKSPLTTTPPPAPRQVTATAGLGRIDLTWPPSGAYTADGYEIARATAPDGPFQTIHSTHRWTTPAHTDDAVKAGQTYFYQVRALNRAGRSDPSATVAARAEAGGPLPDAFRPHSPDGSLYAAAGSRSFVIPAAGRELDGAFAGLPMDGDFDLSARLVRWQGPVGWMGLAVRDPDSGNRTALAFTLGETGARQARFRAREAGGKVATHRGNDYTWLPVWFRLRREGGTFAAFQSADGIAWHEVGRHQAGLPARALAGLLVSGGGNPPGTRKDDAPSGLFDHVIVEKQLPAPPAAPAALRVTQAGGGVVRLEWKLPADPVRAGVKVELSPDGAPFREIADLPADATFFDHTGISNPSTQRYRIRAYHRGGYSPYGEPGS